MPPAEESLIIKDKCCLQFSEPAYNIKEKIFFKDIRYARKDNYLFRC